MKPTTTPDQLREAIAKGLHPFELNAVTLSAMTQNIARQVEALSAALSVPAAAVVGEPVAYLVTTVRTGEKRLQWQPVANLPYNRDRFISTPLYAAPSAPEGWQPIETAPKDGTTLWVLDELYGKPWHYECNWNGIEWYHGFGVAWPDARPTHWRPLPAPPALGGASHD